MKIFMIGTQRSGSNLLRLMMNQSPEISAPHPPHILERLMPLVTGYGDLSKNSNFELMIDDACRLVELNPEPWEGVVLDRANIKARCKNRTLVSVCGAIYDLCAKVNHASSWCCKSLANVNYLNEIETCFGKEARYIHLYRDGRDVALSFTKAIVGEKHIYHIAQCWASDQRLALAQRKLIEPSRFYGVSYEKLTSEADTTIKGLCNFLEIDYTPSMLESEKSKDAQSVSQKSVLWENVAKPLMTNNFNKFLEKMSAEDIRLFELVAGDILDELGYPRFHSSVGETKIFSTKDIQEFSMENERLKTSFNEKVDPEDKKRRETQASLIKEIKARQASV
ncbi:sulfotransferase family protein [Serratia sp. T13T92]|uniref:sulfotransferase family protein n=1 Tax=Serratia sp. T13T92 TaxID=3397496 RepID=UPI0039DF6B72